MRRRLSRRSQLVRSRTRAKNEIHAVLIRRLKGRPPVTDLFGVTGRIWLGEPSYPTTKRRRSRAACVTSTSSTAEIGELDRAIARAAIAQPQVLRLMTVPGSA